MTQFPTSIGGKNLFTYANNNPINLADSEGLITIPAKVISGAVIIGINIFSSLLAAKLTGQEYTIMDAITTASTTAISLILEEYMLMGALVNGVVSAVMTYGAEGNVSAAIKEGLNSAMMGYISICELTELVSGNLGQYMITATLGLGETLTVSAMDSANSYNSNKKMGIQIK